MKKRVKRVRMPKWIWQIAPDVLNHQDKHFLAYIWWCGDRGCRDWNYSLADRFHVCKRQVRRYIAKLHSWKLINIQYPGTKSRTLYRMPFFKLQVWINFRHSHKVDIARTKMSTIYNAKHNSVQRTDRVMLSSRKKTDFPARVSKESAPPMTENETRPVIDRTVSHGGDKRASPRPAVQGNGGSFSNPRKKDATSLKLEKIRNKKRREKGLL